MNSSVSANEMIEDKYEVLVNEMFDDFKNSVQ
jgi:hypothetical protein